MATTFINPPSSESAPVLTSGLYSVKASTDKTKISAKILNVFTDPVDGPASQLIFSTTVYAFGGVVELSDIGSILEQWLMEKHLTSATFRIAFDDTASDFTALFCSHDINTTFSPSSCFLSQSATAIVHPRSAVSLTYISASEESPSVQIVGLDHNGVIAVISHSISTSPDPATSPYNSSVNISFSVNDLISAATSSQDNAGMLDKISYFAVNYAGAQKIFYLIDHPFFLTFRFRNMFNAIEYIDVVGTVKRHTQASRDSAFCRDRLRQYNLSIDQTFEVLTSSLTDDQVRDLEQMIMSHSVMLCAGDTDYDIIIDEHTVEHDNDDESLPSVKFTFRFAGRRPVLTSSDMGALMPSASHIFTQQFSAHFQ